MKLTHLCEKKANIPVSRGSTSGILKNSKLVHLGTGVQAIAYLHSKYPGKVIKSISISGENDPSYQFLRVCMNHQDNPFFPKIYAVKQYGSAGDVNRETDYGEIDNSDSPPELLSDQLLVVMERLYPLSSNEQESINILQRIGVLPTDLSTLRYNDPGREIRPPLSATKFVFITPTARRQLLYSTTDVQFKQALRLLEPLFNKFDADLRQSNIMLRKSASGLQIVLVDPVC